MESPAWSLTYYFTISPQEYKSIVLGPHSKYNHPKEWESALKDSSMFQVNIVDYRPIDLEEFNLYFKQCMQ